MDHIPQTRQEFEKLDFMWKSKVKKRLVNHNFALLTQHLNPNILSSFRPVLYDNDYEEIDLMRDQKNKQRVIQRMLTDAMRSLKTSPSWFDILDDVLRDNHEYHLYGLLNPWDQPESGGEGGGKGNDKCNGRPHSTAPREKQPETVAVAACRSLDPQTEEGHQPQSASWMAAQASNASCFPTPVYRGSCSIEVGPEPLRLMSQVDCDGEPSLGELSVGETSLGELSVGETSLGEPRIGEPGDSGRETGTTPLVLDTLVDFNRSRASVKIENKYYFQDKIETANFMVGERNVVRLQPGPAPDSAAQLQDNDLPYPQPVSDGAGNVRHSGQADVISDGEQAPARATRGHRDPPGLVRVIACEVLRQFFPYT